MIAVSVNGKYECQCLPGRGYQVAPLNGQCVLDSDYTAVLQKYGVDSFKLNYLDVINPSGSATSLSLQSDIMVKYLYFAIIECQVILLHDYLKFKRIGM